MEVIDTSLATLSLSGQGGDHDKDVKRDCAAAAADAEAAEDAEHERMLEVILQKLKTDFPGVRAPEMITRMGSQLLLNSGILNLESPAPLSTPTSASPSPLFPQEATFTTSPPPVSGKTFPNTSSTQSPPGHAGSGSGSGNGNAGFGLVSPMSSLSSTSTYSSAVSGSTSTSNPTSGPSSTADSGRSRESSSSSSSYFSSPRIPPSSSSSHSHSHSTSMSSDGGYSSSSTRRQSSSGGWSGLGRRNLVKILDLGTGHGTLFTLFNIIADLGYLTHLRFRPRADEEGKPVGDGSRVKGLEDEIEIVASETQKECIETCRKRIAEKGWKHVRIRAFTPEAIQSPEDSFDFIFASLTLQWARDEDSTLHEIHRTLKPGGTLGVASLQSLGYSSTNGSDPLKLLPNPGWADPYAIHSKLTKHGFREIQVLEYSFAYDWGKADSRSAEERIVFLLERSIGKLWRKDDAELAAAGIDGETKCEMRRQLLDLYKDGTWDKGIVALITLAKK